MTNPSPIHELLAKIGKDIAEDEMRVRERIDRFSQYDDASVEDDIREEWRQFHARIEPMRKMQQYILEQLAQLEACKPPRPMLISR